MTKLTFQAELNPHVPSERRALLECASWMHLKKEGRIEELKVKHKETVLAGLFLQIAAPEIVHKLVANLDEASMESLQRYLGLSAQPEVNIEDLLKQQFASFDERLKATVTEAAAVKAKHSAIAEFLQNNASAATTAKASAPAATAPIEAAATSVASSAPMPAKAPKPVPRVSTPQVEQESEPAVQRKVAAMKDVRKRNLF